VQQLAGDALRETRALVQGYRRTTLDAEIANASKVLAAAGVKVSADVDADLATTLPEAPRSLLGLVVREATTNLLRHSSATRAAIVLVPDGAGARLVIDNDSVRPAGPGGGAGAPGGGSGDGTGLVSLAERLDAVGGHLSWSGEGDRFVVTATVTG
jgi:two-component system, NarL family, sensor histidine kinase DesK